MMESLLAEAPSHRGLLLAAAGNDNGDLWRYVSMRTPQIIQRFLPFSVLLGTLITMVTLNQNSEVISMKASGLSAHQVLAPLIVAVPALLRRPFAASSTPVFVEPPAITPALVIEAVPVPFTPPVMVPPLALASPCACRWTFA